MAARSGCAGFPKLGVTFFWGPYDKDSSVCGPYFGEKYHIHTYISLDGSFLSVDPPHPVIVVIGIQADPDIITVIP